MSMPPPGWYDDPGHPGALRWFDGVSWTPHTAPTWGPPAPAQLAPVQLAPDPATAWLLPVGRSWQAITAGYLGLAVVVFALIPAFAGVLWLITAPFALVALDKAREGKLGRGRAWFALASGLAPLAAAILL